MKGEQRKNEEKEREKGMCVMEGGMDEGGEGKHALSAAVILLVPCLVFCLDLSSSRYFYRHKKKK